MDQKQTWIKSCLDVYRKFLNYDINEEQKGSDNDVDRPYFYIFNSTFMALFRYRNGKQICQVVPSQTINNKLAENEWIKYTVDRLVDNNQN